MTDSLFDFPYHVFDLEMTLSGFARCSAELADRDKREPQIYVHVGGEGPLNNKIIRIGSAKNGVYERWMKSKLGHQSTFFWSIGESERYGLSNACQYANYLTFFASLYGLQTKLYALDVPDNLLAEEKKLINSRCPIWEQYKPIYNRFQNELDKLNDQSNETVGNELVVPGGALEMINKQRAGDQSLPILMPDVLTVTGINAGEIVG